MASISYPCPSPFRQYPAGQDSVEEFHRGQSSGAERRIVKGTRDLGGEANRRYPTWVGMYHRHHWVPLAYYFINDGSHT